MGMKSPSKFLKLEFLLMLRDNDYCNKDKGIDYAPCEVDRLIFIKQERKDLLSIKKSELQLQEFTMVVMKEKKIKDCTCCKRELPFSSFDKDKSKKFFGLRSHCKDCRSNKRKINEPQKVLLHSTRSDSPRRRLRPFTINRGRVWSSSIVGQRLTRCSLDLGKDIGRSRRDLQTSKHGTLQNHG